MHVSISCNDRCGWNSLDELKSLCRAIIYFEAVIKLLVPEHRQDNYYARWNVTPTKLTSTTAISNVYFAKENNCISCMKLIDRCNTVVELVQLMNNGDKRWSWNFTHIDPETMNGRVEFRSPPGVNNCEDCFAWINFTVEFVHASISETTTLERLTLFTRDLVGLSSFLDSVPWLIPEGEKMNYRNNLKPNE